ncbi:MAG: fibrobacter succinogenes major paralogous domain-containing protein, partial [Bacteroidota bacterium]
TLPIGSITSSSASSGGNITNNGGTNVTQRGVVWSTNANPTTANSSTSNGIGNGSFASNLIGLTASTTYYVRAYAINSAGTSYGNQVSFTTTAGGGVIVTNPGAGVTFNGYTYASVVLGNGQEWMAENLNTTAYNDGTPITFVPNATQWAANYDNGTTLPMMCWADNDQATNTANNFGALYNWYTVNSVTNGNRNVCPVGWHVPSDLEWNMLIGYIDPSYDPNPFGGGQSSIAGSKMKSTGNQYWYSNNLDATNESGFSGLPSGFRYESSAYFADYGVGAYWWSATEEIQGVGAYSRKLFNNNGVVGRHTPNKARGLPVRCLKD